MHTLLNIHKIVALKYNRLYSRLVAWSSFLAKWLGLGLGLGPGSGLTIFIPSFPVFFLS